MARNNLSFPPGWEWKPIGDLVTFEYGKGLRKDERNSEGSFRVYGSNGVVGNHDKYLVDKPCLIIGRKGAAGEVHISNKPCWPIDTTYFVIPPDDINLNYLYHLFSSINLASLDRSTAIPGLNRNDAYAINIPVPPLPEQERIVERIESLFTQLDAGVAGLKRVQAALKRYRASVLKAACEGRLVPQEPEDEPAKINLERLISTKSKKTSALDTTELPESPIGWTWTNFEQLAANEANAIKAGPFGSALKKEIYTPSGYKIYGQEQVIRGDPFFGDYFINESIFEELKSCAVNPGDILISLVGTIGKVLTLPKNAELGIINPRLVKLTLDKTIVLPQYIQYYLESTSVRKFWSLSSHGETMDVLNLKTIKSLPVPLPPIKEQNRIIQEIDQKLSVVQELDQSVTASLKRAARLRQAILKRAFEGRLVM